MTENMEILKKSTSTKMNFLKEFKNLKHDLKMNRERTMDMERSILESKQQGEFLNQKAPEKVNYMIAEILDYVLVNKDDRIRIRKYMKCIMSYFKFFYR